ncbi:hypothetical protein LJC68_06820 [Bacteroidales bacterium OttesenSCG-928-B11]|nr:hypothetical protein [Bacteroidales bacterium OttesenSCG-928-E04]MDL2312573.1 hypothetical protein [Bacteroidales bacterium OttesenSCG-928-B11]MDL2325836.1 hypothetical protein [Bacteroidales bacterium OttesenSCG-928-A14]
MAGKLSNGIPKLIHQIWSGKYEPLPPRYDAFCQTWKELHPDFEYRFWMEADINDFVSTHFPQYEAKYKNFPHDIQRWDTIRYMILHKLGGIYVDVDYECLKNIAELIDQSSCFFALEPKSHSDQFERELVFNNALMGCVPAHPFIEEAIQYCFREEIDATPVDLWGVLTSSGPLMLHTVYEQSKHKNSVDLLPAELVSPLTKTEADLFFDGNRDSYFMKKVEKAYAIHYFRGTWLEA